MKTKLLLFAFILAGFSSLGQDKLLNENVVVLGEKYFEHPVSIELLRKERKIDSCHLYCSQYNEPLMLLLEKECFDTIQDYADLSVFNPNCYLYEWYFFPDLVHNHICPYMDTTSRLYWEVSEAYPNLWVKPYSYSTVYNDIKYDTFYYRDVIPHTFLIVLMNASTYNEYRSHISPESYFYKGTHEENGIYFKVAIPMPEKLNDDEQNESISSPVKPER